MGTIISGFLFDKFTESILVPAIVSSVKKIENMSFVYYLKAAILYGGVYIGCGFAAYFLMFIRFILYVPFSVFDILFFVRFFTMLFFCGFCILNGILIAGKLYLKIKQKRIGT
jgi:hypothetical protein